MKKYMFIIPLVLIGLSGCGNSKITKIEEKRKNYEILNTYDYDTTKEVQENKKTVRELAKDLMFDELGITDKALPYKEVGNSETNGIFVSSGVTDGDGVPETPAISKEDSAKLNNANSTQFFENKKQDSYDELSKKRKEVLQENNNTLGTEEDKLLKNIQERLDEQNKSE